LLKIEVIDFMNKKLKAGVLTGLSISYFILFSIYPKYIVFGTLLTLFLFFLVLKVVELYNAILDKLNND